MGRIWAWIAVRADDLLIFVNRVRVYRHLRRNPHLSVRWGDIRVLSGARETK